MAPTMVLAAVILLTTARVRHRAEQGPNWRQAWTMRRRGDSPERDPSLPITGG